MSFKILKIHVKILYMPKYWTLLTKYKSIWPKSRVYRSKAIFPFFFWVLLTKINGNWTHLDFSISAKISHCLVKNIEDFVQNIKNFERDLKDFRINLQNYVGNLKDGSHNLKFFCRNLKNFYRNHQYVGKNRKYIIEVYLLVTIANIWSKS